MSRYTDWTSGEPIEKDWDGMDHAYASGRADALREAAERVEALPLLDVPGVYIDLDAVLAILEPKP